MVLNTAPQYVKTKQLSVLLVITASLVACAENCWAQIGTQKFDLVASSLGLKSEATISSTQLQIRGPNGSITNYIRDKQHDTADGKWIAFSSRSAGQIVRWPLSNTGNLQLGQPSGLTIAYQPSSMQIQTKAGSKNMGVGTGNSGGLFSPPSSTGPLVRSGSSLPGPRTGGLLKNLVVSKLFDSVLQASTQGMPVGQLLRIANLDPQGNPWLLAQGTGRTLVATQSSSSGLDWYVTPVGNGLVRVQTYQAGNIFAIGTNNLRALSLAAASQDPNQLWRLGYGRGNNQFYLESVAFPGSCLARTGVGGLAIQPINYSPIQMWSPYEAPPVATFQPFWRTVSTQLVPNNPLPPAQVELVNSHRYALVVAVGDVRKGAAFDQIKIQPGQSVTVELERDSGATIVETVEYRTLGGWQQEKYVTAVPSAAYYDLSVYEEHLQSISIDATGAKPAVDGTNYVPKSVGWLPLPPGDAIPASASIDLYSKAKAAKNPGAVRRLDAEQFNAKPTERPLDKLLRDFQKPVPPRRGF
ncbi:MAG: hypothetical protein AAF483_14790 [Planctomycetota bacterium]